MQNTRPSLFAAILRALADWAAVRPPSRRTERRRRARERLKERAAVADFYERKSADLAFDLADMRRHLAELSSERDEAVGRAERAEARDREHEIATLRLADACSVLQREANHWRMMASLTETECDEQKINMQ